MKWCVWERKKRRYSEEDPATMTSIDGGADGRPQAPERTRRTGVGRPKAAPPRRVLTLKLPTGPPEY